MIDLITEQDAWRVEHLRAIPHDEEEAIRSLLLGHRIAKVADDHVQLDDGTMVKVVPNGGCSCGAGCYSLAELNEVDNIITAVEFVTEPEGEEWDEEGGTYKVFVVAEDRRLLLAVEGADGNGYYGTGFELLVRAPKGRTADGKA